MATIQRATRQQARPPLWRNVTVLKWTAQVVFLLAFLFLGYFVVREAGKNLTAQGFTVSADFLGEPPGIAIREGFNTRPETGLMALAVGMVNMLRITISGIIAATILGTLIGVGRLSSNWIVNKAASGYVEAIRNIPLLVQIIFWQALGIGLRELVVEDLGTHGFLATAKGLAFPWFRPLEGRWQWVAFVLVGVVVARYVFRWRIRLQEAGGHEAYAGSFALGTVVLFGVVGWFAHPIMGFLGFVFGWIASFFGSVPVIAVQLALAALAVFLAGRWIKGYLDARRTPAGLAKLTDDDYFRLLFTGAVGLVIAAFILLRPGVVAVLLGQQQFFGHTIGLEPIFGWLASQFEWLTTGAPLRFSLPEVVEAGRFVQYSEEVGKVMTIPFFAIWTGVILYTAAFIAEVVRGGILAVSKGQTEAGLALGLRRSALLRLIVLPQAFRVILPPLGNQYLNLAKNTSLGIAVGYADIVQVGQTLYNQTAQTVIVFLFWMAFFSTISLSISAIVNWYNRRLQIVER